MTGRTIYFSGSISGGREDLPVYRRIVSALESAGHEVFAGSVTSEAVGNEGEALGARAIYLGSTIYRIHGTNMPETIVAFHPVDQRVLFMIPWGAQFRQLSCTKALVEGNCPTGSLSFFGLSEMLVFIAILLVGFVYVWKKGALQWD